MREAPSSLRYRRILGIANGTFSGGFLGRVGRRSRSLVRSGRGAATPRSLRAGAELLAPMLRKGRRRVAITHDVVELDAHDGGGGGFAPPTQKAESRSGLLFVRDR